MHSDRSRHKQPDQTTPGSRSPGRPAERELSEDYVHTIGTACYHLRKRGELQEADKVAWRVLHRLGILRPEQVNSISPEQLALTFQGRANGPLATIFLQVGTSLVQHGKLTVGYQFIRRAVFIFPDRDALGALEELCVKAPLPGGVSRLEVLSSTREGFEWYLERRFKMGLSEQGEMTARYRDRLEAMQFLGEMNRYILIATKECVEIPAHENGKKIALAERVVPCIPCVLAAVGLQGSPRELSERQELQVALKPEEFKLGLACMSSTLMLGAKLYEFLGKMETSACCRALSRSFAEA